MKRHTWFYRLIYNTLFHIALPFLAILQIVSLCKGGRKAWQVMLQRLSFYRKFADYGKPVIWFHGASLGEVLTLIPLMKRLKEVYDHTQVISVTTVRGEYVAKQRNAAEHVVFLPLDLPYVVQHSIRCIQPTMIVILETEIWPNLFWQSAMKNIPVVVVSGRISQRSFPRYRLLKTFFSHVLTDARYLMQTAKDQERIVAIGAPPEQVTVCGDIKYDGLATELPQQDLQKWQQLFPDLSYLIVIGSTHAGEEEIFLDIFEKLLEQNPQITLLLAPRHLERLPEVIALVKKYNIPFECRSKLTGEIPNIVILDTYGELSQVYCLANVVVIGGTFVPIGGHNIMEPAALGKPVLYGPHIFNFYKQSRSLEERGAAIRTKTPEDLCAKLQYLIQNPDIAMDMGNKGQKAVIENRGAIEKCIAKLLISHP